MCAEILLKFINFHREKLLKMKWFIRKFRRKNLVCVYVYFSRLLVICLNNIPDIFECFGLIVGKSKRGHSLIANKSSLKSFQVSLMLSSDQRRLNKHKFSLIYVDNEAHDLRLDCSLTRQNIFIFSHGSFRRLIATRTAFRTIYLSRRYGKSSVRWLCWSYREVKVRMATSTCINSSQNPHFLRPQKYFASCVATFRRFMTVNNFFYVQPLRVKHEIMKCLRCYQNWHKMSTKFSSSQLLPPSASPTSPRSFLLIN